MTSYPKQTHQYNCFRLSQVVGYQNKSKHPLMIVPAPITRGENLLAVFARFSTHIRNRNVMTSSHVCKLMQHTYMMLCACAISGC